VSEDRRPRPATQFGATAERVAANVRALREVRGLSIYSLSDALNGAGRPITPSAVAKIERLERHVTVDDLAALAAALKVTPQQLLNQPDACTTCAGTPPIGFVCRGCGAAA